MVRTLVIAKNSYGYHDVMAETVDSVAKEPETVKLGIMLLTFSKKIIVEPTTMNGARSPITLSSSADSGSWIW